MYVCVLTHHKRGGGGCMCEYSRIINGEVVDVCVYSGEVVDVCMCVYSHIINGEVVDVCVSTHAS